MNKLTYNIKKYIKRIAYGYHADSDVFIKKMRKEGMIIGERVEFFDMKSICIDETRPFLIEIGNDVKITHGVTILTHGYDWSVLQGKYGDVLGSAGEVVIGNNVFIGMNTTILKNVHIGSNTIIGANSLVNKDIPDNCVAVGCPCKPIMTIEEYEKKRINSQVNEAKLLVNKYREVYEKNPNQEIMQEFFWLYTTDIENIPNYCEKRMKYHSNSEFSKNRFREVGNVYDGFDDFINKV